MCKRTVDAAGGEGEEGAQEGEGQNRVEVDGAVAQVEGRALGAIERAVAAAHHIVPQKVPERHLTVRFHPHHQENILDFWVIRLIQGWDSSLPPIKLYHGAP